MHKFHFFILILVVIVQPKTLFYQGIRSEGIHLNLTNSTTQVSGSIQWDHSDMQEINLKVFIKNDINQLTDYHVNCPAIFPSGNNCNFQITLPLGQYRLELVGGFTLYNPLYYTLNLNVGSFSAQILKGYTSLSTFVGAKLLKFYCQSSTILNIEFINSIFQLQFIGVYLAESIITGPIDYIDYPNSIYARPINSQSVTQFSFAVDQGYYFMYIVPMWYIDPVSNVYQQLYDSGNWTINFIDLCLSNQYYNRTTYMCETCGSNALQIGNVIESYKCQCVNGFVWNDQINKCLQCGGSTVNGVLKVDNFSCSCNSGFNWDSTLFRCIAVPVTPNSIQNNQQTEENSQDSSSDNSQSTSETNSDNKDDKKDDKKDNKKDDKKDDKKDEKKDDNKKQKKNNH